jgi:cytochrome c-type biogenesis protein CcmH/NrfG
MADKSNLVKKESMFYALIIGLVAGFLGGVLYSSFKLGSNPVHNTPVATSAPAPAQLENQTREVINSLEAEVTANPDNVEAWTRLGHVYFDTDQVISAIKAYERSLELQPGNPDVWTDLGVMYRRNKQPLKAIEAFDRAYTIQPNHTTSRINKGIVLLYDLNKPEETITVWEELLATNPTTTMPNNTPLQDAINEIKEQIKANKQ